MKLKGVNSMDDFWSRLIYTFGVLWLYNGICNAIGYTDISASAWWIYLIAGLVFILVSARIEAYNEIKKK